MIRTQIYLEETQKQTLEALSKVRGVPLAGLIREAIEHFLSEQTASHNDLLASTFGLWKDHPKHFLDHLRQEWPTRAER